MIPKLNEAASFFDQSLQLELSLKPKDGDKITIVSGHIENIDVDMHSYGFDCRVQFYSFENEKLDELFKPDNLKKITNACLSFHPTDPKEGSSSLLELNGIVVKQLLKRVDQIGDKEQPVRLYEVEFKDSAQTTWKEHFPSNVYVDTSMKFAIEQHRPPDLTLNYDFDTLEKEYPIIAFALPYRHGHPNEVQTHFYSFLHWYLHKENGIFTYDYENDEYSISGKKDEDGDPYAIFEKNIFSPLCTFPEALRYNVKMIKHSCSLIDVEELAKTDAFEAIRRDVFSPTMVYDFFHLGHEESKSSLTAEELQLELNVSEFKDDFHLDKLIPGKLVSFEGSSDISSWSSDSIYKDQVFRSRRLKVVAYKLDFSEEIKEPVEIFRLSVNVTLEKKEEKYVERPSFNPPIYPFSLSGLVISEIGDLPQSTYELLEVEETPTLYYLVMIPLAGDDKQVIIPFTPDFMSGQYYFPFCKGEKVLISLYFHKAKIERVLDWQPLAKLPQGVQGNQIVFASDGVDKYTLLKHEFEDLQNSVLTLKQSSSEEQTQVIQIKEKEISVTVEEKDTKTVSIKLTHDNGIFISLKDLDSGMEQTIVLDGKSITQTCKDDSGTSTYTQKPTSITIQCKKFHVEADSIEFDAKEDIKQKGGSKVSIECPIANVKASSVKLGE